MKHTSFHFNTGDTDTGAVGLTASICATSAENALGRLVDLLPASMSTGGDDKAFTLDVEGDEYVAIYTNGANITVADIDEEEDCECDALDGGGDDAQ